MKSSETFFSKAAVSCDFFFLPKVTKNEKKEKCRVTLAETNAAAASAAAAAVAAAAAAAAVAAAAAAALLISPSARLG